MAHTNVHYYYYYYILLAYSPVNRSGSPQGLRWCDEEEEFKQKNNLQQDAKLAPKTNNGKAEHKTIDMLDGLSCVSHITDFNFGPVIGLVDVP